MDQVELISLRNVIVKYSSLILGAVVLLTLICVRFISRRNKVHFPVFGKPKDPDYRNAILEGIEKCPDRPFTVGSDPPLVILPKNAIDQVKNFKDEQASFSILISREFYNPVTKIENGVDVMVPVVKQDLTRHVASTLKFLQEEIVYALDKELGPCEDWNSFSLYPTCAKIVSLLSGRVFVGRPLSRNQEWVDASINFTFQIVKVKNAIAKWPYWTRRFVAHRLKECRDLMKLRERGAELLKPLVDMQLSKHGNEKLYGDDGEEVGTVISWILARKKLDIEDIVIYQQNLTFAAIHTTTFTVTQAILDLATYPEYTQILLDEIRAVTKEDGYEVAEDGTSRLPKSSIPKLTKLDSFIKESQRMNPMTLLSHSRFTLSEVVLNSGYKIPADTRIALPSWAIHRDPSTLSAEGVTKPVSEFDGLRYYNLRKIPGNENRFQFVSTAPDSLAFGHGNHACPGRFFVSNEIKVILIELLQNWDFRLLDDKKREGGLWRRPKNTYQNYECVPETHAKVEFRRKKSPSL
ncbi:Cytochrome P450 monooxygenase [Podosphaera aphanis]|nr:Cytochrome P450 monooxygenase [Podosphaera aphanis]